MNNEENRLVKELAGTILCYGLFLQTGLLFFAEKRLYVSSGLWIGIMLAVFMLVYMYRTLQAGLDRNTGAVGKYVLMHSVIRYVTVAAVFGIVIYARLGSPFTCFAGVLGLKAAAYLQLLYRKLKENRREKM